MKKVVPFSKARETSLFGSKAVGLGDAARQGLPVPPGVALSGDLVEAVASGDEKAIEKVAKAIASLRGAFRRPVVGRRRRRRSGKLRRAAPHGAQRPFGA